MSSSLADSAPCPVCRRPAGWDRFCRFCGVLLADPDSDAYKASRWRRLGGYILESVLIVITLVVGWLIWLYFTAQTSQTPAKRLLNMYILTEEGEPATAGRVWAREILVDWLLFGVAGGLITGGIASIVDAGWILFDRDNQTLHDKISQTIVIHVPVPSVRRAGLVDPATAHAAGPVPPPAPPGGTDAYRPRDTERRLRELQQLVDDGLITLREYQERRRRILDEM